ncbi:MAG TPA: carboxyl transferase domain-containing protein [Pseudomonadales bacterium]|nr:carboxyl transferase domain-containing protein [Pseudomonadales bacterium]
MSKITSKVNKNSDTYRQNYEYHTALGEQLRERIKEAVWGGRDHLIDRHRKRGKLLPRERIDLLVDPSTPFLEFSTLAAFEQYGGKVHSAGVVTGIGIIHGSYCVIVANDSTVKGGAYYPETVKKHIRAQEIAEKHRLPCIYLVDCGGAYLHEWDRVFPDRDHFGNIFFRQCNMSSQGLPQIAAVFGVSTAGAAYIPALSDEVVMVRGNATIHLGGPSIVKVAINEEISPEELGGAEMHTTVSGVSDYIAETEQEAIARVRDIVSKMNRKSTCYQRTQTVQEPAYSIDEIKGIVNKELTQPYDIREVIARIVDGSDFQEFKPQWGTSLICGTAHIQGYPVGILGNNGPLFYDASVKGAHVITLCEQRNIPLLFLHNVPGFMVGKAAEQGGISKHSAKLVYAMSCAKVPRFSVVVGGSYGAGNYGMCGRGFRPNMMFAWPNSIVATMSADIGTNVVMELARTSITNKPTEESLAKLDRETRAMYAEKSSAYYATSRLWDDGIIEPSQTRDVIGLCLAVAATLPPEDDRNHVFRM